MSEEAPPPELPPEEKIKLGVKLTKEEKAKLKAAAEQPVTLDELEKANDKIIKLLISRVGNTSAKDLPKILEIVRTAITEKKAKGEKSGEEAAVKEPTRQEMLEAIKGRRAEQKA